MNEKKKKIVEQKKKEPNVQRKKKVEPLFQIEGNQRLNKLNKLAFKKEKKDKVRKGLYKKLYIFLYSWVGNFWEYLYKFRILLQKKKLQIWLINWKNSTFRWERIMISKPILRRNKRWTEVKESANSSMTASNIVQYNILLKRGYSIA